MNAPHAPLTTGYALACVALFVVLWITGFDQQIWIAGGFIPARFGADLVVPPGTLVPAFLTPFTAAFLHNGVVHLGFNMVVLLFIGRQLEEPLGKTAMAILLVVGAYAGAFLQWAADPASMVVMIGASGAISAIIAVFALIFNRNQVKNIGPIPGVWVRALWLAAAWIGVQLLMGFAGGSFAHIAIWAHIGGFVAGLLLARPLLRWRFKGR
jgi:membrane associated rhomboid family serine protease